MLPYSYTFGLSIFLLGCCVLKGLSYTLQEEADALCDIYNINQPTNWLTSTSASPCGSRTPCEETLSGVLCINDRVNTISLPSQQLKNSIPASIGHLTALTILDLSYNSLNGTIPSTVGALKNLTTWYLNTNSLSGSLTDAIGDMESLVYLNFQENSLNGTIPTTIGNLSHLQTMLLSYNKLSGEIPSQIGTMSSIQSLWINGNLLSGTVPTTIGLLTNLIELNVASNRLSGTIPNSLANCTLMSLFYFNTNYFSNLSTVRSLSFIYCQAYSNCFNSSDTWCSANNGRSDGSCDCLVESDSCWLVSSAQCMVSGGKSGCAVCSPSIDRTALQNLAEPVCEIGTTCYGNLEDSPDSQCKVCNGTINSFTAIPCTGGYVAFNLVVSVDTFDNKFIDGFIHDVAAALNISTSAITVTRAAPAITRSIDVAVDFEIDLEESDYTDPDQLESDMENQIEDPDSVLMQGDITSGINPDSYNVVGVFLPNSTSTSSWSSFSSSPDSHSSAHSRTSSSSSPSHRSSSTFSSSSEYSSSSSSEYSSTSDYSSSSSAYSSSSSEFSSSIQVGSVPSSDNDDSVGELSLSIRTSFSFSVGLTLMLLWIL